MRLQFFGWAWLTMIIVTASTHQGWAQEFKATDQPAAKQKTTDPPTQDKQTAGEKKAADKKAGDKKAGDKTVGEKAAKKPQTPAQKIKSLLVARKYDAAAKALQEALDSKDAETKQLQPYRNQLAMRYASTRAYGKAFEQQEKWIEFQLQHVNEPKYRAMILQSMPMMMLLGKRAEQEDRTNKLIDKAATDLAAATEQDTGEYLQTMSKMANAQAMKFAMDRDFDGARKVVRQQLDAFDKLEVDKQDQVDWLIAKMRLMSALASYPGGSDEDEWVNQLNEFATAAIESHPDSIPLLVEYTQAEMGLISKIYRDEPKLAKQKIDQLRELIEKKGKTNATLKSRLRSLKSYETRIESALKLAEMVGKNAPKIDVETWINQGDTTLDSLKGKVVMLDFWSVWCGPCIMTFPHLRQWREEFKDDGFEIVGVTRYYNYKWDEEDERAVRAGSGEKVSHEDEQKMLKSFLAHHKLKHPSIITPSESKMQENYGVTGIPHVALIDREGKIQMVKVGAGGDTAKEIHAKISELIKQK